VKGVKPLLVRDISWGGVGWCGVGVMECAHTKPPSTNERPLLLPRKARPGLRQPAPSPSFPTTPIPTHLFASLSPDPPAGVRGGWGCRCKG